MCCGDYIIQCIELVKADKIYIRNLSIIFLACSVTLRRVLLFCLGTLYLCLIKFLENIDDIVSSVKLNSI